MERMKALIDLFLEEGKENIVEIRKLDYLDNCYEVETEDENIDYLVLTEKESLELAKENVQNIIDDMGLCAFSESFQEEVINTCIDNEHLFKEIMEQEYSDYVYNLDEEDLKECYRDFNVDSKDKVIDYLVDNCGEYKQAVEDFFGRKTFIDIVELEINWDRVIKKTIDTDGIAHFVASYDGKEKIQNGYYIYRVE